MYSGGGLGPILPVSSVGLKKFQKKKIRGRRSYFSVAGWKKKKKSEEEEEAIKGVSHTTANSNIII